jgi:hypothetical protein
MDLHRVSVTRAGPSWCPSPPCLNRPMVRQSHPSAPRRSLLSHIANPHACSRLTWSAPRHPSTPRNSPEDPAWLESGQRDEAVKHVRVVEQFDCSFQEVEQKHGCTKTCPAGSSPARPPRTLQNRACLRYCNTVRYTVPLYSTVREVLG